MIVPTEATRTEKNSRDKVKRGTIVASRIFADRSPARTRSRSSSFSNSATMEQLRAFLADKYAKLQEFMRQNPNTTVRS
jgi:hypothetical protein